MRYLTFGLLFTYLIALAPISAQAAGSISASGGGTKTVGQQFTVTVSASGATFDSLQGTISVSGPVSIVSFAAGSATWLPGKTPANGSQFVGITSATSSLTVARITLKGTKPGSGSVSVSGVKLAQSGSVVGTGGSGTNFTIQAAPDPPGSVKVTSSTHPDQNQAYEATAVSLAWEKESGVSEFSYLLNQTADTTPEAQKTSSETAITYENQPIGTHYFHIRARNADGWGPATHFKITIKEPEPKVDEALEKPQILSINKADDFATDLEAGTATSIIFSGRGIPSYKLNLTLTPAPTLPEGTTLTADTNATGEWQLPVTIPLKAGFYTVTAQSQLEKVLSPVSETTRFEISLAEGGAVRILTERDAIKPAEAAAPAASPNRILAFVRGNTRAILAALLIIIVGTGTLFYFINRPAKKPGRPKPPTA